MKFLNSLIALFLLGLGVTANAKDDTTSKSEPVGQTAITTPGTVQHRNIQALAVYASGPKLLKASQPQFLTDSRAIVRVENKGGFCLVVLDRPASTNKGDSGWTVTATECN